MGSQTGQRNAALIVNTQSRSGQDAFARARELLGEAGVPIGLACDVDDPARLNDTIHDALNEGYDPIIIGGGDGSISSAADVLARHSSVLGLIPLGTANDFARTMGIPDDLEEACAVIAHGCVVDVDLGVMGDCHYVNLASVGLSGEVTQVLPGWLKRVFGPLAYPLSTAYTFLRYTPFDARLTFPDGDYPPVTLRRLLQLGIGNGRFYGGGMLVAPDARPDNGKLDVYAIEMRRWRKLIPIALALKTGTYIEQPGVHHYRTTAVTVQTKPRLPINVDGDLNGTTPQRFSITRAALHVLVPESSPLLQPAGEAAEA